MYLDKFQRQTDKSIWVRSIVCWMSVSVSVLFIRVHMFKANDVESSGGITFSNVYTDSVNGISSCATLVS